jgi:hypothetical protein
MSKIQTSRRPTGRRATEPMIYEELKRFPAFGRFFPESCHEFAATPLIW